jgi:ribosomal protein S18 acetylase RimI-like enzyme
MGTHAGRYTLHTGTSPKVLIWCVLNQKAVPKCYAHLWLQDAMGALVAFLVYTLEYCGIGGEPTCVCYLHEVFTSGHGRIDGQPLDLWLLDKTYTACIDMGVAYIGRGVRTADMAARELYKAVGFTCCTGSAGTFLHMHRHVAASYRPPWNAIR